MRQYGAHPDQIGNEATWEEHLEALLGVFRALRRVLRPDASLWLNYADAYTGAARGDRRNSSERRALGTLAPKNLMLLPERLAMAMQEDGWYLRSKIPVERGAPKPESVDDRPASAYDITLLMTPNAHYFYDPIPVRTPPDPSLLARLGRARPHGKGRHERGHARPQHGLDAASRDAQRAFGSNLRNLWRLGPEPRARVHDEPHTEHTAAFPVRYALRCLRAALSERGVCPHCAAPWRRLTEKVSVEAPAPAPGLLPATHAPSGSQHIPLLATLGWTPTCGCPDHTPVPPTVIDPFAGSGTTGVAALRLGANATLIELNAQYARLAAKRCADDAPLLHEVRIHRP